MTGRLDPDPLYVEDDALWDPVARSWVPRPSARPGLLGLLLAGLSGAIVGAFLTAAIVHAMPRTAQPVIPAAATVGPPDRSKGNAASENPAGQSGPPPVPVSPSPAGALTPRPPATLRPPTSTVHGIASYVDRSYGALYLALPDGRGHRVLICGPANCVIRVSTDAGPDLAMQRLGRIADLSFADFATVCGCSPVLVGTVHVSVGRWG